VNVLEVSDLKVTYSAAVNKRRSSDDGVKAVDGISFDLAQGETLGIVGESGCGKSTTARAVLDLVAIESGRVSVCGEELGSLTHAARRRLRQSAQMIFQDPFSTLDPRMRLGAAIAEPIVLHGMARGRSATAERVVQLLEMVGLPPSVVDKYPHEMSGGQLQRVGIARALSVEPSLIVADEPVSALDVSIQAQVLNLMSDLQEQSGVSYLFIGHDLAVVKHVSHRIAVMYLGRIVEMTTSARLFDAPLHPYTAALLSAAPVPDPVFEASRERILLSGDPPSPRERPRGCPFRARCPMRQDTRCDDETPVLREVEPGHLAACHFAEEFDRRGVLRVASIVG